VTPPTFHELYLVSVTKPVIDVGLRTFHKEAQFV
jgi:hypothetical protein